jgi:trehalose 6-phosphate synthase/phosphatase
MKSSEAALGQDRAMQRMLLVSNRLPLSIEKRKGELLMRPSVGGLATGLKSLSKSSDTVWIGWPGIVQEKIREEMGDLGARLMSQHRCYPVFLTQRDLDPYYHGFSNKTLWPLCHYFTQYAVYEERYWRAYQRVNRVFADTVLRIARPDDIVWVHDYHLMLVPCLLREKLPDASIGFFLHIPFPSFEIFRLLPWREVVLKGLLGADLVGFHTSDYVRHFVSSAHRLLGCEHALGQIGVGNRVVKVDAFPMGIDYERFAGGRQDPAIESKIAALRSDLRDQKVVLSIDRLDYSKGIPHRLEAFAAFLRRHRQYRGKVTFLLSTAPSRERVEHYESLKSQIGELVGRINGEYGTFAWTPVRYIHRPQPFADLVALFNVADVYMVTPLRDGMNLMAKEFVASKADERGVLILSEMAGAAKELGEALLVNPNNETQVVRALEEALRMSSKEIADRSRAMRQRILRYDVAGWVEDFIGALAGSKEIQKRMRASLLTAEVRGELCTAYRRATRRLWLLDYDGTLVPFADRPQRARPGPELLSLLRRLSQEVRNEVVLISGRDKGTLANWFGSLAVGLVAEHGIWIREPSGEWEMIQPLTNAWKGEVRPVLERYADRTPGAFIEEKDYSLVWHYRRTDSELSSVRVRELMDDLAEYASRFDLHLLEGSKVVEIKNAGINKGRAALRWVSRHDWDFVLGIGDDRTDEDVFAVLPSDAYSIRVGLKPSRARFNLESSAEVVALLKDLVSEGE